VVNNKSLTEVPVSMELLLSITKMDSFLHTTLKSRNAALLAAPDVNSFQTQEFWW
jgi:hypothetical protein